MVVTLWYINIDPEHHQFLEETIFFEPLSGRVELLIYWRVTYTKSCSSVNDNWGYPHDALETPK